MDEADGSPALKRRLRLELAAALGAPELAAELAKRLDTIAGSQARVHWRRHKEFRRDLDLQRNMIAGPLAGLDPGLGLRLMLRFLGLERAVLARVSDLKGEAADIFTRALADLAALAPTVAPGPADLKEADLVDAAFEALKAAGPANASALVQAVLPALGDAQLSRLRQRLEADATPQRRAAPAWRAALRVLLEAQGDVDALADSFTPSERVLPPVGARLARAFLAHGRPAEAELALDRARPDTPQPRERRKGAASDPGLVAWEAARTALMEATGRAEEAQALRWAAFERDLDPAPLRDHLRRLSGFDDVVAEDKAVAYALAFPDFARALRFLVDWPKLEAAAALVLEWRHEIDGVEVETLEPAARALEARYPQAALILLRAMVLAVTRFAQSELYERARTWLLEIESLAAGASAEDQELQRDFAARVTGYRRW